MEFSFSFNFKMCEMFSAPQTFAGDWFVPAAG
jgi:hypothetical protein